MTNKEKANAEWQELLKENTRRFAERMKELKENNVPNSLDGTNYFQDIEEWFKRETIAIQKKYS